MRRNLFLLTLSISILAAAGLLLVRRSQPHSPGPRIAFIYQTPDAAGLYTIGEDGSNRTRLAISTAIPDWFGGFYTRFSPAQQARLRPIFFADSLRDPSWLGVGGRVGFHSRQIGESCEWVARTAPDDGSSEKITCLPAGVREEAFAWAPDGSRFAFADEESGYTSIRTEDADGQNLHHWVLDETVWGLAFNPDSSLLAVTADAAPSLLIYAEDGLRYELELPSYSAIGRPAWSPDGDKIAVFCITGDVYLPRTDICSIGLDGTGFQKVALDQPFPYIKTDLQWSPSGERLSFVAVSGSGFNDIFLMDPDGGNLQPLTSHPAGDSDPAWSPDGSMLVFASNRAGNWELYTIRADGTHLTRLTFTDGDELEPVWVPFLPSNH